MRHSWTKLFLFSWRAVVCQLSPRIISRKSSCSGQAPCRRCTTFSLFRLYQVHESIAFHHLRLRWSLNSCVGLRLRLSLWWRWRWAFRYMLSMYLCMRKGCFNCWCSVSWNLAVCSLYLCLVASFFVGKALRRWCSSHLCASLRVSRSCLHQPDP